MKKKTLILLFILIVGGTYIFTQQNKILNATITGKAITQITESDKHIQILFCPQDDCAGHLLGLLNTAKKSIHCSLYDLDIKEVYDTLVEQAKKIDVKVVMDNENALTNTFTKKDTVSQLMHNKFCIIDNTKVFTGSFNPTINDNEKNNNNMLLIESALLAKNYENEFAEEWAGTFGEGEKTKNTILYLNTTKVENYFCPEDWCTNHILQIINNAKESIYFMTFSFTSDPIADALIQKRKENLTVKGIMEKKQANRYDEYSKLKVNDVAVQWDANQYNMHHKVFIIDEKIIITGSFNPSKNAETNNDENILIIHDEEIAKKYVEEFERLYT